MLKDTLKDHIYEQEGSSWNWIIDNTKISTVYAYLIIAVEYVGI